MPVLRNNLLFLVLLLSTIAASAQGPLATLDDLQQARGKFTPGFKRSYASDISRTYPLFYMPGNGREAELLPRPMVINTWFPAKAGTGRAATYSLYLEFTAPDSLWSNFLGRLRQFQETTIKENAFRYTKLQDTLAENKLWERLRSLNIAAVAGAAPAPGTFPLVIYQPSLGGTVEENALLCQYLAAHGYIVVSCAYQAEDARFMGPDWDLERSRKDVQFLLDYSRAHLPVDTQCVHLLGYSFGAQSGFNLLTRPNPFISAVSLDSRLEYAMDYAPKGYKNLPEQLLTHVAQVTQPLLLFTGAEAVYKISDSLVYTDRYYVPLRYLEHHDFAATRQISNYWVAQLSGTDQELTEKTKDYLAVCDYTLAFFNFYSEPTNRTKEFAWVTTGRAPFAEHIKKATGPDRQQYTEWKTPRQALLAIEYSGLPAVKACVEKNGFSYSENILNDYAYYLVGQHKNSLAIAVLLWATELHPRSANLFDSLGEIYFIEKAYKQSLASFETSLQLHPSNKNALKYIENLKGLSKEQEHLRR